MAGQEQLNDGPGNLWRLTAPEPPPAPPLDEHVDADLAIVGGGFTGCSAALHAAERGLKVRLVEAETIGHGGSGRNVGLVNAGLWLPPEAIAAQLGEAAGGKLNSALAAAPDLVFSLIERHGIDCEAVRSGTLHLTHAPKGLSDLQERHRQLADRGAPVTLLDAGECADRTGTDRYLGALHDARAGTIQPLAYCRGLASAAQRTGACLHEATPAIRIERDNGSWRVATPNGSVTAPALLLATNAYHAMAAGVAAPDWVPVHFFQMATAPLGDNLRRTILPNGEGCWDTAPVMSSFRMDEAGRLILGGMGSLDTAAAGVHRAWARRQLGRLFPRLADQPLEHAWTGRIAMTADHIPKVLRLGPNGFAVFGYSGRGIGPGTLFGKAAAAAIAEGSEVPFPAAPVDAHAESFKRIKGGFYEAAATAYHGLRSRLD